MSGKISHNLKRKREAVLPPLSGNVHTISVASGSASCAVEVVTAAESSVTRQNVPSYNRADCTTTPPSRNVCKKVKIESAEENANNQQDFVREALKRVLELERELSTLSESSEDDTYADGPSEFERNASEFEAEALGFAVCARETLHFLAGEGLQVDDPLVQSLRQRLVGKCNETPFLL